MSPEAVPLCASLPPGTTEQRLLAREAAVAAGTYAAWPPARSKLRSAIWRRGRARALRRARAPARPLPGLSRAPPVRSRNVGLGGTRCRARQTPRVKSTGLRFPRATQYSPTHEAFPKEAHDVRIVESLQQGVRSLLSSLFRGSQQLGSREPLVSNTRTNVLFKFWLGKRLGAPPAGDTVLRGDPAPPTHASDAQNSTSAESLLGLAARPGKGDTHY